MEKVNVKACKWRLSDIKGMQHVEKQWMSRIEMERVQSMDLTCPLYQRHIVNGGIPAEEG